jgi:hypothetical protein
MDPLRDMPARDVDPRSAGDGPLLSPVGVIDIRACITVTADLPTDRGGVPAELAGNRPGRVARP